MNSSSDIQVFNYENKNVRTIYKDDEIWFVAQDVCDILELSNPIKAIKSLDDDEKMTLTFSEDQKMAVGISDTLSGKRDGALKMNVVSEPGLYALVFRSNKPEAKNFSRWVCHKVIP